MTKVIREYIKESEMYRKCVDTIPNIIWDSQKLSMQNEADEHQRKADELAEIMNEGISPYAWYVKGRFDGEIGGFHYNVDNIVYLDRNQQEILVSYGGNILDLDRAIKIINYDIDENASESEQLEAFKVFFKELFDTDI